MNKLSLKSFSFPKFKYDISLLDNERTGINFKVTVDTVISTKDRNDNYMQINLTAYTNIDSPFMELSVLGKFEINAEDKDIDDYHVLLKSDGFPLLYHKLQEVFDEIVSSTRIPLKKLPNISFNDI